MAAAAWSSAIPAARPWRGDVEAESEETMRRHADRISQAIREELGI